MVKAKRMCISQHMLQHIMKLMLALRIVRSPFLELTHRVNMFIARMQLFVNRKFLLRPNDYPDLITRLYLSCFGVFLSPLSHCYPEKTNRCCLSTCWSLLEKFRIDGIFRFCRPPGFPVRFRILSFHIPEILQVIGNCLCQFRTLEMAVPHQIANRKYFLVTLQQS